MAKFGDWQYYCDRESTIDAYSRVPAGGSDTCDCAGCRNFTKVRESAFPLEFVEHLKQFGIDPGKDAEVYHIARHSPGLHYYGGWFHFVGKLKSTGDFHPVDFGNGFKSWLCLAGAPRLGPFNELEAVQLEFSADNVPWVLDEPQPE